MTYNIHRVRERAEAHIASGAYSSIEWHIEMGGKTLTEGAVGFADALTGSPLPDVPIYRIFSMTKPLVSAVAVMLIDEGKLRLSDAVASHLPTFSDIQVIEADGTLRPVRNIMRIEHLFTHRSGFTYQWQQNNPVAPLYMERLKFQDRFSLEELVTSLAELPLLAEPGTMWHYSFSTDVLGHVVSLIEGKPLGEVLAERIFEPLGMTDTAFFVPEAKRDRLLPMFGDAVLTPGVSKPASSDADKLSYGAPYMTYAADNPAYSRGGSGLFSTLQDYVKAARFLISGLDANGNRILSKFGVSALWTNRLPESQMPISVGILPSYLGYGYGLGGRVMVHPHLSPFYAVEGEAGWVGAGTTYFWLDPKRDITGVMMSQYLGPKLPLGEDIRDAFYQSLT